MIRVQIPPVRQSGHRILCLGAHPDDIEIGCGGTVLTWLRDYPDSAVRWVVFSAAGARKAEARRGADLFLGNAATPEVMVKSYTDGFFPGHWSDIKQFFERELKPFDPDLILTHYRDDRHQDHRVISDLTWNTFRDHLVLEYEIPKYDGDLGRPNFYVPLEQAQCREKVAYLLKAFPSQQERPWFEEETFWASLRLRGLEAASTHAEAFYAHKLVG